MDANFMNVLNELSAPTPSRARAVSASDLAFLVHLLAYSRQVEAFKRAVQIVFSTPDMDLICNAASALGRLDSRCISSCVRYLMEEPYRNVTPDAFYTVPEVIGKALSLSGRVVEQWYDTDVTSFQTRPLVLGLEPEEQRR